MSESFIPSEQPSFYSTIEEFKNKFGVQKEEATEIFEYEELDEFNGAKFEK